MAWQSPSAMAGTGAGGGGGGAQGAGDSQQAGGQPHGTEYTLQGMRSRPVWD